MTIKPFAMICIVFALCTSATASDDDHHDHARAALENGLILPLETILERVADITPGKLIDVELEHDDGAWLYELEIRSQNGRLVEVEVDATTGAIVEMEND